MSFPADKRKEHEDACAQAIARKHYARARFHAAKTADFSLQLAEITAGKVANRYVDDAFEWIHIAEDLAKRADAKMAAGRNRPQVIADDSEETAGGSEWQITEKPAVSFEDIAGMEEVKQLIRDMILDPLGNPETAEKWRVSKGGGILMFGPPGNGKTTLAKAIAHDLACPFYSATGADIRSKWSGEAEKRMRQLITQAKSHPVSVLFIDDLDGLLPRRGGQSVVDNRVVCQFLNEIGGFEPRTNILLLLGATNSPWEIDDAVFRTGRFDEKLFVGLPDVPAREQILRRNLEGVPVGPEVDLEAVAQRLEGYTGSDIVGIASACKRAGFRREIFREARCRNHAGRRRRGADANCEISDVRNDEAVRGIQRQTAESIIMLVLLRKALAMCTFAVATLVLWGIDSWQSHLSAPTTGGGTLGTRLLTWVIVVALAPVATAPLSVHVLKVGSNTANVLLLFGYTGLDVLAAFLIVEVHPGGVFASAAYLALLLSVFCYNLWILAFLARLQK